MTYMSVAEGYLLYFLPVNYFDYVPVMVKTFVQISLCVCVFIYSITILIYYLHYKTQNKKKVKMVVIRCVLCLLPAEAFEVLPEPEPPVPRTKFQPLFRMQPWLQDVPPLPASPVSLLRGIISTRGSFSQLKKSLLRLHLF